MIKNKSKTTQLRAIHKEILNILNKKCGLSASEIFEKLKLTELRNISQTTTYRAINFLCNTNLIKPLQFHDGHTRYELIQKENHHHHFICTSCNELFPIDLCPYNNIEEHLPEGFKVKFHNFEVFGICKECNNNS